MGCTYFAFDVHGTYVRVHDSAFELELFACCFCLNTALGDDVVCVFVLGVAIVKAILVKSVALVNRRSW